MIRLVILMVLAIGTTSCFRSWRKNDRDIRLHYQSRAVKPTYHTLQEGDMQLFVATTGADTLPPLLLVHGAPGAWYGYLNVLDDSTLQQQYHIISFDRLGYNKSKLRGKRFVTSIETHARAAAMALSLNRSGQKGVVLGRSFGAPIAAKVAIERPERIARLIMLAPAIDPKKEKFWWFSRPARWWAVRVWLPRQINTATYEKFAHKRELEKLAKDWERLEVPTTVVQGGKDWIVDPANLDFACEQLLTKQADYILLPEAGHLISYSHPELVRALITRESPVETSSSRGQ